MFCRFYKQYFTLLATAKPNLDPKKNKTMEELGIQLDNAGQNPDSPSKSSKTNSISKLFMNETDSQDRQDDIFKWSEKDLYKRLKKLESEIEFHDIQEEYIKYEQKNLKRELLRAKEEVKRIQSVPLVIGQFLEMIDTHTGIIGSTTGSNYYVRILSTIDRELLKPSASVALHRHSNALVDVLPPEADSSIQLLQSNEKPDVAYTDIGGMDIQKQEMREAVELPLTQADLYKQIGIDPPRGVLMYGPPGTGLFCGVLLLSIGYLFYY